MAEASTDTQDTAVSPDVQAPPSRRRRRSAATTRTAEDGRGFRHWRRQRPFIGGVLVVLGGIELFFSGQLDTGNIQIQFGIEGLQATVIPLALVLLGVLAITMPTHHVFYGILALIVAIYSLVGVNLGGFVLGMLLASIGAVLVVGWMGPCNPASGTQSSGTATSSDEGTG
ncbi:DUF6114 domain-containing protein [Brevibacterium casei]|uniref:DUF6114 domain-containing protein n=1 Tax=Brevibacterium casei TaxID=33889 RepID=UPI00223BDA02|nr:DUF6114 domain-containing protein [Brevibacterium casei]MCT1447037.1 DUF6114 domain-containing protein [Brevibacterium casei]